MIRLKNISKSFPESTLFENVNLSIKKGMRAGLVGPNGTGKTTLLRLMLGLEAPDEGAVQKEKSISIGYLAQDIIVGTSKSILEEVLGGYPQVRQLESEMLSLSALIGENPDDNQLLNKLGDVQLKFEALGGWSLEDRAKKILSGLGFREIQFSDPLEIFSGGYRMRVALAAILLQQPHILFLDEPTNHLDLEATLWLESFLADWKGGLVMISHDRSFLDMAVNFIIEIERGRVLLYTGNYSAYQETKRQRLEQQRAAYINQQKYITQTKGFIERFRYKSTKATQVQSRIKMLEKLEKILPPDERVSSMQVNIPQPQRSPLKVSVMQNVKKTYGELTVFEDLNLIIERHEKIGLAGHNGAGKSTLLKMLAGVEAATGGSIMTPSTVQVGYFAQHQLETLDPQKNVYESIQAVSPGWSISQIRSYLGGFLFSGDEVEKKVKVLSGGEKSRLALARMLVIPVHLLLLDEPTNHLDMVSRNVVESILKSFTGAIVCISHDRHFLNAVTSKIIEVGDRNIRLYTGNYDYYSWKKDQENSKKKNVSEKPRSPQKKKNYKEQKKIKNRLTWIKKRFNEIEITLEQSRRVLNDPDNTSNYEKIQKTMESMTVMENEYLSLIESQEKIEIELKN